MSRLQKKKPVTEKKKKRPGTEDGQSGAGVSSFSSSKSAPVTIAKKPSAKESVSEAKEPSMFQKAADFLREVKIELKKVTWPTRKQTTGTTIVVIIFVFVIAVFLGLFDLGLSKLVQVVLT